MNELVEKISKKGDISEKAVWEKIKERQEELSNLISEKGAAHMVAKEMGIEVGEGEEYGKVSDLSEGKTKLVAKVLRKTDVKEFDTEKGSGEVANIFLGDETGKTRLSLWNEQTQYLDEIDVGDVLEIDGFTRTDNFGNMEIILGKYGKMKKSDKEVKVKDKEQESKNDLANPKENQYVTVRAGLLKVFENNPFFTVCGKCGKSLDNGKCEKHGKVKGKYNMVISGIIDDGKGSIRAVFFGSKAEKILGMEIGEAKELFDNKGQKNFFKNIELGKEFVFAGKVKTNKFTNSPELVVDNVKNVNVQKEIERLIG